MPGVTAGRVLQFARRICADDAQTPMAEFDFRALLGPEQAHATRRLLQTMLCKKVR